MKKSVLLVLVVFLIIACKKDSSIESEIAKINIDITVERFDQFFGNANEGELPNLKKAYPFMFAEKYPDSFWIEKLNDTIQHELTSELHKAYPKDIQIEEEIESLFNHLKYYFPAFHPPRVITYASNVDYRNKVIITDTIALIALDTYLGEAHHFYGGIQKFLKKNFEASQIAVDMATEYAKRHIFQSQRKTLLDEMIYFGKQLYFKDMMLPNKTEAERIAYTADELKWAQANEQYIWRYFIERELLFSTDSKLPNRFINPAPFTKFYLEEIDTNSPGRLGQYIGWQIVRAYMENNKTPFETMLKMKSDDIFNNSKFKPKKIMGNTVKSKIELNVELDENRVPEKLFWSAEDGGISNEEAKAMMLSVWDDKAKEMLRIDLWTKDMPVDDMKIFFHQTLVAMANTFNRATQDEKMTATMKDFCDYFAEKLELKK